MKQVIRLRVLLDHEEDVFRDLELNCSSTFLDLHQMIIESFGFTEEQMASFYVSNEDWEKGQEITLMDMGERTENGEPILMMHETSLKDIIFVEGQKLLYVFDFFLMWCFYIDVITIKKLEDHVITPRIVQSFGTAPGQYSKSPDFSLEVEDISENREDDLDEFRDMFDLLGSGGEEFSEDRDF
jgi:hypothetical protein